MTYGAEVWTLTKENVFQLRVAQIAIERAVLDISIKVRVRPYPISSYGVNELQKSHFKNDSYVRFEPYQATK